MDYAPQQLPLQRHSRREHRLDFWRGLCLIDMIIVHLVSQGMQFGPLGHEFFTDYTRFAAGGYVLLSGMTVGFIYYPRVTDGRRWSSYFSLLRRSAYIFWIHCAVTMGQFILCPLRGEPMPPFSQALHDVLLFREGYDLLPFYVIMLALCPLILEVIRRRMIWLVPIVSLAIFFWGSRDEHYKAHSLAITQTFFLELWQLPFVIGLLAGTKLRVYDTWRINAKRLTAGAFWACSVVLFFAAYGQHFNRPLNLFGLTFWKNPLTFGEVLRYLGLIGGIVTTTDLAWRFLQSGAVARFVERMGRRSLAMYIAQIFLVGWIDKLNDASAAAFGFWGLQFFFMALALAILWAIALTMDWFTRRPIRAPQSGPSMPQAASQMRAMSLPS